MDYLDYYQENGYVIYENLVPDPKIDQVLTALQTFKEKRPPYYSQSIHSWIRPEISNDGFMTESMENFTQLMINCGLKDAGNKVILGSEISDVLKTLNPLFDEFVLWQNMLFDRSTGTVDHYDSWYLDTLPRGHLTAAWIALEDIEPDCGPFRVFPGSHKYFAAGQHDLLTHDDFVKKCREYSESHEYKPALLKKGSVLFWHPCLLHGALNPSVSGLSRKSLTAHYYPLGMAKKYAPQWDKVKSPRQFMMRLVNAASYPRQINNSAIYCDRGPIDRLRYNSGLLSFAKNQLTGQYKVQMDMRRRSYGD
ncbi:MAG: phytanoyl-CoA dioxygenase family protein [Burkholderiaceae bacterium]